jgi:hypothetical protein
VIPLEPLPTLGVTVVVVLVVRFRSPTADDVISGFDVVAVVAVVVVVVVVVAALVKVVVVFIAATIVIVVILKRRKNGCDPFRERARTSSEAFI